MLSEHLSIDRIFAKADKEGIRLKIRNFQLQACVSAASTDLIIHRLNQLSQKPRRNEEKYETGSKRDL